MIKVRPIPKGNYATLNAGTEYPAEARALHLEGVTRVRLLVDARGKVASRSLLNRLGHGLDELAMKYAEGLEFEPARNIQDEPVASVIVWTFNMSLPNQQESPPAAAPTLRPSAPSLTPDVDAVQSPR